LNSYPQLDFWRLKAEDIWRWVSVKCSHILVSSVEFLQKYRYSAVRRIRAFFYLPKYATSNNVANTVTADEAPLFVPRNWWRYMKGHDISK